MDHIILVLKVFGAGPHFGVCLGATVSFEYDLAVLVGHAEVFLVNGKVVELEVSSTLVMGFWIGMWYLFL